MPVKQQIAVITLLILFIIFVFNLVRTRKLREAYSAFWLLAPAVMMVLVIRYDWLVAISNIFGIVLPTSTILLLSFIFFLAIQVQVAGTLTQNHSTIQTLIQEMGLLSNEIETLKKQINQNSEQKLNK